MLDAILHYLKSVQQYEVHLTNKDTTGRYYDTINTYSAEVWHKLKPTYDRHRLNYVAFEIR